MTAPTVAESADVDDSATIGDGTSIWGLAQVREGAVSASDAFSVGGVGRLERVFGDRVKIQNFALIYEPALIDDGAFIGPGAVLTNDLHPRAINPDGTDESSTEWDAVG